MRVDDLLEQGLCRSFEFFPPKNDDEAATLSATITELADLDPSFVSVTYRGGRESRQRTFDLVSSIEHTSGIPAMAHLICVGHTREEMREILSNYVDDGIDNIMALGGDIPTDPALQGGDFVHAIELVELARSVGEFSVGVAAHPLGHPRSTSRMSDRRYLAEKLRLADFAVTQFFFDVAEWRGLVDDLEALGVDKPVIPGIMPVTTLSGAARMAEMGAAVPAWLMDRLEGAKGDGSAAVRQVGIEAATELCFQLLDAGAPGLHFYTLNRSTATREIHARLFPL
ncbi:MAG: methylenetetrahydrofolate reductase [Acidobacteria bacterium]|nr:methylenetetrahydrofolate reductase [Acidobacteriota bacterium]